jgi:hypothetical protein
MSIRVITELYCNGRIPDETWPRGHRPCGKKFDADPELGYPTGSVLRRTAAKAGWTHIPSPLGRKFDKDYCPKHKPTEGENP